MNGVRGVEQQLEKQVVQQGGDVAERAKEAVNEKATEGNK
jgi:hypothetical protein